MIALETLDILVVWRTPVPPTTMERGAVDVPLTNHCRWKWNKHGGALDQLAGGGLGQENLKDVEQSEGGLNDEQVLLLVDGMVVGETVKGVQ